MEEPRDHKPSAVFEIAIDGDTILVVGPERKKLRVHSLFLKAASKPFSAMLGPDWKEGHNMLGRDGPVELPLPEDDSVTMELICAIIHHQNELVPGTITASDTLKIAVTVDKYDCADALKFAGESWLQSRNNKAGDLILLTAAAYLFRNARMFRELTEALILHHSGPYLTLSSEEVESAMTWRVFCLSEEQRSLTRLRLAEILIDGINDRTGLCVHNCGWTSKYAYAYLKLLEGRHLWPTHLLCISEAIELAEKMRDPIPQESSIACTYGYKHAVPEYRESRRRSLDGLNGTIGLCLNCVRSGRADSSYCEKH